MPRQGASNEYHSIYFFLRNKKNIDTFWLKKSALPSAMLIDSKKNDHCEQWTQRENSCSEGKKIIKDNTIMNTLTKQKITELSSFLGHTSYM